MSALFLFTVARSFSFSNLYCVFAQFAFHSFDVIVHSVVVCTVKKKITLSFSHHFSFRLSIRQEGLQHLVSLHNAQVRPERLFFTRRGVPRKQCKVLLNSFSMCGAGVWRCQGQAAGLSLYRFLFPPCYLFIFTPHYEECRGSICVAVAIIINGAWLNPVRVCCGYIFILSEKFLCWRPSLPFCT